MTKESLTVAALIKILKKLPPRACVVMPSDLYGTGATNIVGAKEAEKGYVFLFPEGEQPDDMNMDDYMASLREEAEWEEWEDPELADDETNR